MRHSPGPAANSIEALIKAYKAAPEWSQLAESTRVNWQLYLDRIETRWGELQVRGIEPRHVLALRDKFAKTPAAANNLLRCLSSMLSWSVPRGWRPDNPCRFVPKLKGGEGYQPWPWEMIELVREHGPTWMWQATALALYTGQRQGDVLAMTRAKVRNGLIEVKQEKTGRELVIPAHQKLLAVLATMKRDSVQLLTNTRGRPWTQDGFHTSWAKALAEPRALAGGSKPTWHLKPISDAGLVFHGLRKSAVVMLLEVGCTTAEVQAITGQSMQMVEHYAKQVSQKKLAASAILKWERGQND
jgi:Phage integrase family